MRVLFVNPANYLETGVPQGISLLIAVLKREGHSVDVFDTSFMKREEAEGEMAGPSFFKSTEYILEDLVKDDPVVDIEKKLQKKINGFRPGLVAFSTMTSNFSYALSLIRSVKPDCPVIFGGVHPTLCPGDVLEEPEIDYVCIGEGEDLITELCESIENGSYCSGIANLGGKKKGGAIFINGPRKFVELDSLPCLDWSLFDERHFFRPFMGQIYRGGMYISSRGCPCACTYCVNDTLQDIHKGCGKYFRTQEPETTAAQIRELKEKYGVTWFKFGDDTFLLQPVSNLKKLRDMIKPMNIMFGCSVRPNTVTEEKVQIVKDMGCVAMSVGIETGNETIRKEVLNRNISDEQIVNAFNMISANSIRISTFNLIGLPGETRENVFETIKFNRKLKVKAANVYIVYPFPGSRIYRKYHLNYRDESSNIIPMSEAASFALSEMSPGEVEGLRKTFNLYLCLPEEYWPEVKQAEGSDEKSDEVFNSLNRKVAEYI